MNIEDGKGACMLPDCQRMLTYPDVPGVSPLFCRPAHAAAYRRRRRRLLELQDQAQTALDTPGLSTRETVTRQGHLNKIRWHLVRYPDLGTRRTP